MRFSFWQVNTKVNKRGIFRSFAVERRSKWLTFRKRQRENHAQKLKEIGDSWGIPVYRMAFDECNEKYELIASRVIT